MDSIRCYSFLKSSELYALADFYQTVQRGEYRSAQKKLFLLGKLAEPSSTLPSSIGNGGLRSVSHDNYDMRSRGDRPTLRKGKVERQAPKIDEEGHYSELNKYFIRQLIKKSFYDLIFIQIERYLHDCDLLLIKKEYSKAMMECDKIDHLLSSSVKLDSYLTEMKKGLRSFISLVSSHSASASSTPTSMISVDDVQWTNYDIFLMNLSLLHRYYHNKAVIHLSLAKGEEYSNTLVYLNKALEIKKEYFYFFDLAFPFFFHRNSQQQLLTGFSSTPFSPAVARVSTNDGYSSAASASSSFLISSVSYFLSHYQDSEETLLLCYVQCGKNHDAISLIKFMKQQKSSTRLQHLKGIGKKSNSKDESKENKEKDLVNNLCHAVCLVKTNRLLEAEAILSNSSSLDLIRQLNRNPASSLSLSPSLSPSKPTSSASFISPSASMIERYWMILVKQINNERMTFAQEINNFQLNRPILSFYHQEKQPTKIQTSPTPVPGAISSPASLVNSPKDKNHQKFKMNTPEKHVAKNSLVMKANENIYKTIHFMPSTLAVKKKAENNKVNDTKIVESFERNHHNSTSTGKFSPYHRRCGSTNSNMLSRSFIIGDVVSDIKVGEEIGNKRFPNHSRKSPIFQSGDLREISKLSSSNSIISLPRLSTSTVNVSLSSQPADNLTKMEKPKSQHESFSVSTSKLGDRLASVSHYFSDPQSSSPRHVRSLSKLVPSSPGNEPAFIKSSISLDKSTDNITSSFSASEIMNKPRYKSTSTDLFEMKKHGDIENDFQKKSVRSRGPSPLTKIAETANESSSGKEKVESFVFINDNGSSSPFGQLNNAGSLFTLSQTMKMSDKPKRHVASSSPSTSSSSSSSSDDKGNTKCNHNTLIASGLKNSENVINRADGIPAYHAFNESSKDRPLSRVEEKAFLLSSLGGVEIVSTPSRSAVPSVRSSASKFSEPSLSKSQQTLVNSVNSKGTFENSSAVPSTRSDPSKRSEASLAKSQQSMMNNLFLKEKSDIIVKVDIPPQPVFVKELPVYPSNLAPSGCNLPSKHNYSHSESSLELNPTSSSADPYALAFKASYNSETSSITYPSVAGEPVFASERHSLGNDDNVSVKSNTSKRSSHSTLTNQSNDHYFISVQKKSEGIDGFIGRETSSFRDGQETSSFRDGQEDVSPPLQYSTFDSTPSDNLHISSSSSAHSLSGSRAPSRKSSFSVPPKHSSSTTNTVVPEPLSLPSFPCDTRDTFYLYSDKEHKRSSSVGSSSSLEKRGSVIPSGGSGKHISSFHNSIKVFYPHDQLKAPGPYPSDVDIKCRELFLTDQEFYYIFQMTKQDFIDLPLWKQKLKKKSTLLF
jgi:hypothetical protein